MTHKQVFLQAIAEKKLLSIKFNSSEKGIIERICVPFDFAPSSRAANKADRYQVYDLNSPTGQHNLAILPEQIISIKILEEMFHPSAYVNWPSPYKWEIQRDWGIYS